MTTRYVVELFGPPRRLARAAEVELHLPDGAVLRDALQALGREAPALLGCVLAEDGGRLVEPYALNLNGRHFASDLGQRLVPGDRILIMLPAAGG